MTQKRRASGVSRKAKAPKSPKLRRRAKKRGTRISAAAKEALTSRIEVTITKSKGLGLAAIAEAVGQPKPLVARIIRDLLADKRIAKAGDRRFTRYARDAKTARAASKRDRSQ